MEQHEAVHPYLDNCTGQKFSQSIRNYFDERILMMDSGNKQKKRLRLKLGRFLGYLFLLAYIVEVI